MLSSPLSAPSGAFGNGQAFIDTQRNAAYYSSTAGKTIDSVLRWNAEAKAYEQAAIEPFTVVANRMLWDPARDRGVAVTRVVPEGVGATDYQAHEWNVVTYTRQEDGSFEEVRYRLPSGPTGWNRSWYNVTTATGAVAADGSIILPRPASMPTQLGLNPTPVSEVGVQRIVLDEETLTATVTEVPGSQEEPEGELAYEKAFASANGHVSVVKLGISTVWPTRILQARIVDDGGLVGSGEPVELSQKMNATIALSPVDGTIWHNDNRGQRLTGVRDGRVVYSKSHDIINTRVNSQITIGVLDDGDVWLVSSDGTPAELTSSTFGYARFEVSGYSPVLTDEPEDASVTVEPGGRGAVSFSAAATGTPAPSVRWQRRAPGSARFVDLAGRTATTLEVDAAAVDNRAAYRAVFTNAAGELATEAALLDVLYAPTVSFDPVDQGAVEGGEADFDLLVTGSPDPTFTWQRRVNGFWEPVDPDSGDFVVAGNELTVKSANLEMNGALFRAKVSNTVGVAFSRAAKLTVKSAVAEPVTFGSGSFDWGFANRWRCYVVGTVAKGGIALAGGVTAIPGKAASGSLCPGAGAGSEALRFPVRGGSYDPGTGDLEVKLNGSVRFWGRAPPGGAPQLDTTFSNLRIAGTGDSATLYADATGATMANPTPTTRTDVPLVAVDLDETGPAPTVDGLAWEDAPTTLTGAGAGVFDAYPAGEPFDPVSMSLVFGTPQPDPEPQTPQLPRAELPAPALKPPAPAPAAIEAGKRRLRMGSLRAARLATLSCPPGPTCTVSAPRRIVVEIGGERYRAAVLVPKRIGGGRQAGLRIRLSQAATDALADRRARVKVAVTVSAGADLTAETVEAVLRG